METMRRFLCGVLLALSLTGAPAAGAPQKRTAVPQTQAAGKPDVKVWVNTKSDVYHCPGTKYYGNTKEGMFMTQKEAQEKGYRPAYGKVCQ